MTDIATHFFTLPNFLSFLRVPLAFCLFIDNPKVRFCAVFAAMVTDILDGYIARRQKQVSKLGILLDPITDKLFVVIALVIFFLEQKLNLLELIAFLSRDVSLVFFTAFLWLVGAWSKFTIRSFYCGKIMTTLQFLTLLALSLNMEVAPFVYVVMAVVGGLAFFELLWIYNRE